MNIDKIDWKQYVFLAVQLHSGTGHALGSYFSQGYWGYTLFPCYNSFCRRNVSFLMRILTSEPLLFSSCQQQLPATGVLITRQRFDHLRSMFDEYVRTRTLQNWKFWIVSFCINLLNLRFDTNIFRAKSSGS